MVKNIFVIFLLFFFNNALCDDKINVFDPKTMGGQWLKIGIFSREKIVSDNSRKKRVGEMVSSVVLHHLPNRRIFCKRCRYFSGIEAAFTLKKFIDELALGIR